MPLSQSKQAAKSVFIIIIFGLGSKLLGFIREMLIAAKFGSGMETGTFFIALAATGFITSFLTGSLSTTMIPVCRRWNKKRARKGGRATQIIY